MEEEGDRLEAKTHRKCGAFFGARATKANTIELTRLSFFLSFALFLPRTDALLTKLMTAVTPVLKSIRQEITDSGKNIDETLEKGREIYARKPAIKNEDVTWSQEEYADLGLIFEYCRYKSIQRLTEAWSTFEKAKKKRLFEFVDRKVQLMDERREKPRETNEYDTDAVFDATKEDEDEGDKVFLRVASLGGGPGFELLAFKWFIEYAFRANYNAKKHGDVELISLDLAESWEKICNQLHPMKFSAFDLVKDGDAMLEEKCGGAVDVLLLSYVAKMYCCNDECYEWISKKINDRQVSIAFVISRDEKMEEFIRGFEKKGVLVTPLMDQTLGKDHRLLALTRRLDEDVAEAIEKLEIEDNRRKSLDKKVAAEEDDGWTEVHKEKEIPPTFPNVPYVEHRKAKVDKYQNKKAGNYHHHDRNNGNNPKSESYSNFSRNSHGKDSYSRGGRDNNSSGGAGGGAKGSRW